MKKAALSIVTACVFCVAMAVAQSSTGQDQGSTGSQGTTGSSPTTSAPSSQDQTAPSTTAPSTGSQGTSPDQGSMGQGSSSGSSSGSMGQGASGSTAGGEMKGEKGSKGEKTLKGCVKSEGGQTVLEEKKGKEVPLTGSDLSAHVGHEVKVHGMWEKGGSATPASSGSAGASNGKTFNVTSVDMVSDTCSMGKSSKGDHMKGGSSDTSKPPQP